MSESKKIKRFALHSAAKIGDKEKVAELIDQGLSPDVQDRLGFTPLHWAAYKGHQEVAAYLIESKCAIDLEEANGKTPLVIATDWDQWEMVALLLNFGANANYYCPRDHQPTLLSRAIGNASGRILKIIAGHPNVDLNFKVPGAHGRVPIPVPMVHATAINWVELMEIMVRNGADVSVPMEKDPKRATVLHEICKKGYTQILKLVIDRGSNLNPVDNNGLTPLHCACYKGDLQIVKLLVEGGANLNALDDSCSPPLHHACYGSMDTLGNGGSHAEIAKLLIDAGADKTIRDAHDMDPVNICVVLNNIPLLELLIMNGFHLNKADFEKRNAFDKLSRNILADVEVCTHDIINRYNRETLPAIYDLPFLTDMPPPIESLLITKDDDKAIQSIRTYVGTQIGQHSFCDVVKARPIVTLQHACVNALVSYELRPKTLAPKRGKRSANKKQKRSRQK